MKTLKPAPAKPPPKVDRLAGAVAAWKRVADAFKANPKLQVPY